MHNTILATDWHINHKVVAEVRGFKTKEEHDKSLYEFLSKQKGKDLVYLGDLSMFNTKVAEDLLFIVASYFRNVDFVFGNHDRRLKKLFRRMGTHYMGYSEIKNIKAHHSMTFDCETIRFSFSHFPQHVWDKQRYGGIHLHGHVHGALATSLPDSTYHKALDLSYEANNKWGLTYQEIMEIMEHKQIRNT